MGEKNVFQKMPQTVTVGSPQSTENSEFPEMCGVTNLPFCHQPCHRNLQQRLLIFQIWYSQPCQGGFIKAFVPYMDSRYWSLHCHMKIERANRGRLTQWGGEQYRAQRKETEVKRQSRLAKWGEYDRHRYTAVTTDNANYCTHDGLL